MNTTDNNSTENSNSNPDSSVISTSQATKPPSTYVADPTARFRGIGINFRAKLIGIDEVLDSRGDQMCQESLLKLKAAVKASGQHKQKMIINVSLEGIKVIDQLSGQVEHVHPVHRISFISRDLTDRRAFGYVYGVGDGKHQFFGIKTQKIAEGLVLTLRDLFQVVYNMKKKEMETSKEKDEGTTTTQITVNDAPKPPTQDGLLDLQTQLNTLQDGINTIDAIKPWDNGPTTPDAGFPGNDSNGDMFGANLSDISSLSSEFSCASNTITDYGYAGGGKGANSFVRTGSSASSKSAKSKNGLSRSSGRSKPLTENPQIKEEHEVASHNSGESDIFGSKNSIKPPSEDESSFFSEVMTAAGFSETTHTENTDKHTDDQSKTSSNGETSSIDSKGHKSSKKHSKFSNIFKSKSERSKRKRKSKKHGDMASSASSIPSNSEEDHKSNARTLSMSAQLRTSSTSLSTHSTPIKKRTLTGTLSNSDKLERTRSTNSVNSVQSCCPVVTTTRIEKGHSSHSLEPTSSVLTKQKSVEHIKSSTAAAIELKKSSLVPRSRPSAKHKTTPVEENHKNPPMFKSKYSSDENVSATSPRASTPTEFKANWEKLEEEAFADFKAEFPKDNAATTEDEHCDPFTGLQSDSLTASNSIEGFNDSAWGETNNKDNVETNNNLFPLSEEDPFANDPFKDETVDNIHDVIEKESTDPFEKVDPFALDMNDNETIFSDPFENINIEDPFQDMTDQTLTEDTFIGKFGDFGISSDELSSREPTFPHGSEDVIYKKKISVRDGVDSSSITSGLSTPIHDPSSPVVDEEEYSPPISIDTPIALTPPPLPPRLPPRRKKTIEIDEEIKECPNIPPPPLPDDVAPEEGFKQNEEDNNILPPNFSPPKLPPNAEGSVNGDTPPAIPKRKNSRLESPLQSDNVSNPTSGNIANNDSYASDLLALNQTAQAAPGSKLTNDQILDGFKPNPAMGGMGMPQQGFGVPQAGFGAPQAVFGGPQPGFGGPQPAGYVQQQYGMQANMGMQAGFNNQPMAGGFGSQPGFNAGGFQQPQMPPRRAAPPQPSNMMGGRPSPSPFGDTGVSMFSDNNMLTPKSNKPPEPEKKDNAVAGNDPFADLVGGLGSKPNSKKDMFKDFQMAKPKPPSRASVNTESTTSSKFDNFMFNNVGVIPLQTEDEANNNLKAPTPAPRQPAPTNDPFGFDMGGGNIDLSSQSNADPFGGSFDFGATNNTDQSAMNTTTSTSNNNFDSLFG